MDNKTIFIVDDEPDVSHALRWLFESVHLKVETYTSAYDFLAKSQHHRQGCLIVDVRMPEMSGLELLEKLNAKKNRLPVIMITGFGDIAMAIRAMKLGAVDFILKPLNHQDLLESVQKCLNKAVNTHFIDEIHQRLNRLSERERQVIELIIEGRLNKEIAYKLAISISTVEAHRANIMRKMQAKNLAQLIKLYLQAQVNVELA